MKSIFIGALVSILGAALTGCGSSSTAPAAAATVSSITVAGTAPAVGAVTQFSATANLSNSSTQSATALATWSSSNASVASVSSAGVVTGVAAGEADIIATYQNVTGRSHVTIAAAGATTFTLSGTVTDGTSRGVLPNINIQVTDSAGVARAALTSSAGTFSIGGLAGGSATVSASAVSYQTAQQSVTIAGDTRVDLVLQRVACSFTLSTTSISFAASGGPGSVTVTSQATGCAWQAISSDAFISVTSGSAGVDGGTVGFSVAANTGAARSGRLTIAGTIVTVTQAAAPVMITAVYDPTFKAPLCNDIGLGCDSGTLLQGSGVTEPNQPNTIFNSCPDGVGTGHYGLISYIRVTNLESGALAPGKSVRIDVSAGGSSADYIRVYFAADAQQPVWTQVGSIDGGGGNALSFQALLQSGSLQAVRVTRAFGNGFGPGPCSTGPDDDVDDLVFRVR